MLTNEQIDFTVQTEVNVQAKYHLEWLSETCRLSPLEVKDSKGLLSNRRDSLNQESPDTGNVKKHLAGPTSSCKLPPPTRSEENLNFPSFPSLLYPSPSHSHQSNPNSLVKHWPSLS